MFVILAKARSQILSDRIILRKLINQESVMNNKIFTKKGLFFCAVVFVMQLSACGSGSSNNGGGNNSSSSSSTGFPTVSVLPDNFPTGTIDALPQLTITTENAAAITSKETYVNGNFVLANSDTSIQGTLEIRGRGNSTWSWPKKPYRLKLTSSTSLLGMPASRHWVLLANYADKTLVRNDVALMFASRLGFEFTPRAQYVELTMNGSYEGVYQIVEHIRIAKDRVNIPELKVTDTTPDVLSGGYLLEVDFRHHKDFCKGLTYEAEECAGEVNIARDVDYCIDSTMGMNPFCVDTPETLHDNAWITQRNYISQYIVDTESALFGVNFTNATTGYAAYIDVDSAVNYYIINELFKNVDGATASFYLYKKRDGKLFFGPVWDFDLALGNAGYGDVDKTYGWHIRNASWFARLFQDPAFVTKVKAKWQAIKLNGDLELIFQYAQARAVWLDKAQKKNFERWPIFDWREWYTRVIMGSYDLELKEMIRWQRERAVWMDIELRQ
jgi:hypothetical protein